MGLIPQTFINDLLERIDVSEVIGTRLELKKAGREFKALCPFHSEKSPSFHVVPEKGFYHCFGCGANGTALTFLIEHDRLEFVEAVEALAAIAGVEVPREAGEVRRDEGRSKLLDVVDRADRWFRQQLRSHPDRERAVAYLRGRGVDGATALTFGIGYAPAGYHNIATGLGGGSAMVALLVEAGLLAQGDDGRDPYDRFRDRIIFPIRDSRGRTIAFGGRVLDDSKPKYLNSPETPLFHKGRELYGLHECRKAVRDPERVLLVEGYMDVVGLAQAGIPEACASLGTAATEEHLRKLFRIAPEVVFSFDGDAAGTRAAFKAVTTALGVLEDGVSIRLLFLPDGEDPDTLVRKEGEEAFRARLAQAVPLSEYLFDALAEDLDTSVLDGRSRLANRALPLIERIPGSVIQSLMRGRLAELTHMPAAELERIMNARRTDAARTEGLRSDAGRTAPARAAPDRAPADVLEAMAPDPDSYEQGPPPGLDDAWRGDDASLSSAAAPGAPTRAAGGRGTRGTARETARETARGTARGTGSRVLRSKEDVASSLLLRNPELADAIDSTRIELMALLERPGVARLVALLRRLHDVPGMAPATLIAEFTGTPDHGALIRLASGESMLDRGAMRSEFDEAIVRIEKEAVEGRRGVLMARIRGGEASEADIAELMTLKRAAMGVS